MSAKPQERISGRAAERKSYIICRRSMRSAVAGASAARHAAALSRPVRGGVGQVDAVAASQTAAMADGCVAQHVRQVAGNGRMLLVHNSMLKPSRSIKMLTEFRVQSLFEPKTRQTDQESPISRSWRATSRCSRACCWLQWGDWTATSGSKRAAGTAARATVGDH
eukprot:scaffold65283_cov82-Phaeocystis_antarctica.AAC.1